MSWPLAAAPLGTAALLAAKATLLLGLAALGALALRRSSAARRHLLWSTAMAGLLALPVLSVALPGWRPAFLAVAPPPAAPAAGPAEYVSAEVVRFASHGPAVTVTPAPPAEAPRRIPLSTLLAAAWAAGALWVLGRLAVGIAGVRRMARQAEEVADPAWTEDVARLSAAVGVRRPVRLLRGGAAAMPMTWGVLRPVLLLPAAAEGWSPGRRRAVLLHELAHVARGDCLTQCLAQAACALHWFHPGAWWAAREMRREREQACDDRVLAAQGGRASEYAEHLLEVARACRAPASAAAALAMARPSDLEGRLRAVLDPARDRHPVTARTGAICLGAALLALLPLAAATPSTCCAGDTGPRRVSLVLPVQAEMGPAGTARGTASTRARINGEDVQLDLDVQVTLLPGGRAGSEAPWRAPAFADPGLYFAAASAEADRWEAPEPYVSTDGEATRAASGAPTVRPQPAGRAVPQRGTGSLDASIQRFVSSALARLPADAAADDDCPERRKAREAVRASLAEGLREARRHEPDALRVAARFIDLDRLVETVSAAVTVEVKADG